MNAKVKRKSLTFFVFLAISTALWLLIKLSQEYTTQSSFTLTIEDVPCDNLMSSHKAVEMARNTKNVSDFRLTLAFISLIN